MDHVWLQVAEPILSLWSAWLGAIRVLARLGREKSNGSPALRAVSAVRNLAAGAAAAARSAGRHTDADA
jgi:hypothetical protein